ncbi:protein of unknown function (plasmid) [Cupriavidus taiwanensis]|uniref:Uncharacterized protein n=1 Tax=Cupriavidus taiwanensis TaxID=164546 RepID=A0A375IKE3_9BURK|nr:hypothetical protein CBM2588_B90063 [Cupriavidus taiwanensis]SOY97844.1 hypothetical protein CBM2591_B80059 [Cupriavidus taiwanensis]SOZ67673.1 hypothetical protein CBM2617_B110060 [Cupriavidus taiwanensis]SOZ84764.1 hypothetical protein CBM2618_B110060 [Cupriavidus taiwanensis]SOZ87537.1 hypothetical protein CBM2622_B120059 [Cupriavidus taiwanensis]
MRARVSGCCLSRTLGPGGRRRARGRVSAARGVRVAGPARRRRRPVRKGRCRSGLDLERAAFDLVAFQRLEQCLEVAFAEAFVALALDELEEHRAERGLGEDLQQQTGLAAFGGAVQQDAARLQLLDRLAVAGQAGVERFVVVVVRRGHQRHAGQLQAVDDLDQVVGQEGDVLDALAVECHQELFDLAGALGRFLVQRNADFTIRRGHGLGGQAGVLALDVEIADFAEIEQLFVEVGPVSHAATVDVVGQVVDQLEAVADRVAVDALDELEVDVIDRLAFLEAVDQVQRRAADALDRRQAQLHRAGRDLDGLRAQCQRARVGLVRILDAESHAAGARAVLGGKVGGVAVRLAVDDEVDVALAVQHHVLGTVLCHQREAHLFEQRLKQVGGGRGEFHEFEAHQLHRIVKQVGHGFLGKNVGAGNNIVASALALRSRAGPAGLAPDPWWHGFAVRLLGMQCIFGEAKLDFVKQAGKP